MKCPCEVDHWRWVVSGLQGIAGMMQQLRINKVPVSEEAKQKFETEMKRIADAWNHTETVA